MRYLIGLGVVALLASLLTGLTQVQPGEIAVVRRFGRVLDYTPGPGLYVGLPWGMERVDRVKVDEVRRVPAGFSGREASDSDITPPGHDKGTFVEAMAKRLGIPTSGVAVIGDMENDLPMFAKGGLSFAMGNASDDIKRHATHVTTSNEEDGFAKAMDVLLKENG